MHLPFSFTLMNKFHHDHNVSPELEFRGNWNSSQTLPAFPPLLQSCIYVQNEYEMLRLGEEFKVLSCLHVTFCYLSVRMTVKFKALQNWAPNIISLS